MDGFRAVVIETQDLGQVTKDGGDNDAALVTYEGQSKEERQVTRSRGVGRGAGEGSLGGLGKFAT